jgi:hypothetical protein
MTHVSYPKLKPYRNEAYRRKVAALPCVNCGISGFSQCAHANGHLFGKGGARKADDLQSFPLCCTRPMQVGCHALFDQYKLIPADELESTVRRWIYWTHTAIANNR